jgi:hypothetical protein
VGYHGAYAWVFIVKRVVVIWRTCCCRRVGGGGAWACRTAAWRLKGGGQPQGQTARRTDGQADSQPARQPASQPDRQTDGRMDGRTDGRTDGRAGGQTGRQTDKYNRHIDTDTDTHHVRHGRDNGNLRQRLDYKADTYTLLMRYHVRLCDVRMCDPPMRMCVSGRGGSVVGGKSPRAPITAPV